jgi:hypothetical protein
MKPSPLMIEIALYYHCAPSNVGDYGEDDGRHTAPAVIEVCEYFKSRGLLRAAGDRKYTRTRGLEVYVDGLCSVPLPVQQWVIPTPTQEAAE